MDYADIEGLVFNIQRYSIDDGPGVRTTVFLKGCPLACDWCSNPESISPLPQLSHRYTSCTNCGTCAGVCPNGAISQGEEGPEIDRGKCVVCGTCVKKCLPEALSISGKKMTVKEVYKTVKRDKDYYDEGGGGCTCSGGEILMQPDFVAGLFRMCRENGINNTADTSGYGSREALDKIMEYTDLFYYDLKHIDPEIHRQRTGRDNGIVLDNLRYIAERKIPIVIRIPLIPGITNTDENLSGTAKLIKEISPDSAVSLLPFHEYGSNKYRMTGSVYKMQGTPPLSEEEKKRAKEIFISCGLTCTVSQ
ncbi:MAG: glycyl-radical enzyme activating protein [Oscillospiraceae bacterium]|nr:glycyl-radical enzyme activating protein [Oscillospiraceae bacterium]